MKRQASARVALVVAVMMMGLTCPAWADNTQNAGGGQAHPNMQPYQAINYLVALRGLFPSEGDSGDALTSGEQYLGSIGMFAGTFSPRDWALADGQILPINQYQALYSLLGTTYGCGVEGPAATARAPTSCACGCR